MFATAPFKNEPLSSPNWIGAGGDSWGHDIDIFSIVLGVELELQLLEGVP